MSNLIRNTLALSALNAGFLLGIQHEAFAETPHDPQQVTTTTTTTETTLPAETTTTTTETTLPAETTTTTEAVKVSCEDPNNIELVRDGETEYYDSFNKSTAQFCGRILITNPTPIYQNPPVKGKQLERLPRTGNHTAEKIALGLGLIVSGRVLTRRSKQIKAS